MTTRQWQNITDYMDTVGTTLKTFTFPKTQNYVNVTIRGNANVSYTIGSQSGTLTPGQSIGVSEKITSFNLTAASGTQTIEVWATEDGTQKVEDDSSDSISGLASSLASKAQQSDMLDVLKSKFISVYDKKYTDLCPKDGSGNVTDWLLAINQAITDALSANKEVFFPYGSFPYSDSIIFSQNVKLRGMGKYLTILKPQGAFPAIVFNGNSTTGVYYNELNNLKIDGGGVATIGVQFNYARECWIEDCYITNCVKGVTGNQAWSNTISNSKIMANTDTNVELGAQCNAFNLNAVQMDNAGNYGLHLTTESYAVNLFGCTIQNNGKDGILADSGRAITICGGYLENNNTSKTSGCGDIRLSGSSSTIVGFTISSPQIWSTFATASIVLDKVYEGTIMGVSAGASGVSPTTNLLIQTSANTQSVFDVGNYHNFTGSGRSDTTKGLMRLDGRVLTNVATANGVTANRPGSPIVGQDYFDTTLNKPIWCKVGGASPTWVDATGATV